MSLSNLLLKLKGGSGSGNFGHSGRPGKRGGSSSSSKDFIGGALSNEEVRLLDEVLLESEVKDYDIIFNLNKPNSGSRGIIGHHNDSLRKISIYDYYNKPNSKKLSKLNSLERAWVLAHELGHADQYSKGLINKDPFKNELYAERFARKVMKKVLDGPNYEKVKLWRKQVSSEGMDYLDWEEKYS